MIDISVEVEHVNGEYVKIRIADWKKLLRAIEAVYNIDETWTHTQNQRPKNIKKEFATDHHQNCKKYDTEGDAKKVIEALLKGVEVWANDEDGIPDHCWVAYQTAKHFLYRK